MSSSQYVGVTWNKPCAKWIARCGGKYLGLFDNEEDAALAYDAEASKQLGDRARLNFPSQGQPKATKGPRGTTAIPIEDLVGVKHNRLTVIAEAPPRYYRSKKIRYVQCLCECGQEATVRLNSIRTGNARSCGCLSREAHSTLGGLAAKHKNHPLFHIWNGIRKRCADMNNKLYGGRGIQMYGPWRNNPSAFFTYIETELGPRPSRWYSMDRIDVDGNYEPGNLRWATPQEQSDNQRRQWHMKITAWVQENYPEIYDEATVAVGMPRKLKAVPPSTDFEEMA